MASPRLVQAKLHVPGLTSAPVVRERLTGLLDEHPGRVILLSAPAGFGKTVLVADWLSRRAGPSAWLSLDPLDNEPARFREHLVAALGDLDIRGRDGVVAAVRGVLPAAGSEPPEVPLGLTLAEALSAVEDEGILVLDDLQEIQAPAVLEVVETLIQVPDSALRVVLLGRLDPSMALGRLRVSGQLLELRARELAFTPSEAQQLLGGMLDGGLTPSLVEALTRKTEGWPAGLRLAGIALAGSDDPARFVTSFAGTHRFVTDYLMEEALGRQPPELQQFLMESAVLDRFDAVSCREILDDPEAPARLATARAGNLFLVPLGEGSGSYRYHHLFGELLTYRLGRLQPGRFEELHGAASRWFEARGEVHEALEHAARMSDRTRLLEILDASGLDLLGRSEMAGLRRWLGRVDPADRGPYPLAFCAEAWLRVVTERVPDLDPLLRRIQEALAEVPADYPPDRSRRAALHTRVLGAYAARYRFRLGQALEIGREAEELLEGDDPLTRGFLVYNTGRVRMALGEMEEAADLLDRALPDHLRAGNRYLTLATLGRQGAIRSQTDGVEPALQTLEGALAFARDRGLGENPALCIVHLHRGWVHLLAHDLEEADAAFVDALERATPRDFPEERGNGLVGRARVAMARGELGAARDLLVEVSALEQVANVDLFETTLRLEWMRLALRREEMGSMPSPGPTVDPVPAAADGGWGVHRETAVILGLRQALLRAGPEGIRRETARLVTESAHRKRGPALLVGRLVQALDRENPDRWATLDLALRLGAGRGYLGPVLEMGERAVALLRGAVGRPELSPASRAWAEALLGRAPGEPARERAGDSVASTDGLLTPREEEVLAQLFTGKSNKAIARSLFVSVDTVKTHLKHVYAKLGVSGRSQAILRAREMGWDPPVGGRL